MRATGEPKAPVSWWPMIFSILFLDHFNELLGHHNRSVRDWVFTGLGVVAGMALFAAGVNLWQGRRPMLWVVGSFMALWLACTFCGLPSHWFIDFAAIFIPWAVRGDLRRSTWLMTLLICLAGVYVYLDSPIRGQPLLISFIVNAFILVFIAAWQVWLARMALNLHRLAQVAECERISRDLDAVLGNALSEITSRSERACHLLRETLSDVGPDVPVASDGVTAVDATSAQRAACEISAVETLCRKILAEVRQTLRAYRTEGESSGGAAKARPPQMDSA
jgi:hypothetical protein